MKPLPKHQNDFTDEAFLREFAPESPSLATALSALDSGEIARARNELVRHFRTRKRPKWIADFRDGRRGNLPSIWLDGFDPDGTETLRRADLLLENVFELGDDLTLRFNAKLDWVRPDTCDIGVPGNAFRFGRYFHTLAAAYALTGASPYAVKFAELADRWVQDWPFSTDSGFHKDTVLFGTDRNYKTLPTASRMLSWLSCVYGGVAFAPEVPVDTTFALLKALWFTASHYLVFARAKYQPGNHHVMRCGAIPGVMGMMFPETPRFRPFLDSSRRALARHVRESFLSDGGYEERSISYTSVTLNMFLIPLTLAKLNRVPLLTTTEVGTLRRCTEQVASLFAPTGYPLPIGDGGRNEAEPFTALLYRMEAISRSRRIDSIICHLELDRFVPPDLHRTGKASPPPPLAVRYPVSGYAVIRSGWSRHDSFASMSIPNGTNHVKGHAHDDALSLDLVVRGVPIVVPPAEELYLFVNAKKYRHTAYRGYPYSMESHNLVLVGGKSLRSPEELAAAWSIATPAVTSKLETNGRTTILSASHSGYPETTVGRSVEFSEPDAWTVTDTVVGPAATKHLLRWHFDYGVEVETDGARFVATKDGVTLEIELESDRPHRPRVYRNAKWLRPNSRRAGEPFPLILDVRFGGSGNDRIVTRFRGSPDQ
jgi:hypothetical protein